jgi:uncharacterized membrane protein
MDLVARLFSHVCGQVNLCEVSGQAIPLCYRCTGLYFGAALALILSTFRPRARAAMLWVNGIFMLVMLPFGYHLVPQGPTLRMITGQLFAYGLVYYLLLIPAKDTWARDGIRATAAYFIVAAAGVVLLLALVRYGGHSAAIFISAAAVVGLVALSSLTLASTLLICISAVRSLRGQKTPQPS